MNRIGGYELLERIGHGATGRVWRARHVDTDTSFAVKVLREELADEPEVRARFLRDAAVLTGRVLPGAVRVYGTVEDDDRVALVMDLVEGADLRAVIDGDAPLAPSQVCSLGRQLAVTLAAAHRIGLVHRDVKPENVLIRRGPGFEETLLTDFGLSQAVDDTSGSASRSRAFGSPHYVAPERLRGESAGPPADVYALGIVLHELAAGCRPFRAADPAALMHQHLHDEPRRLDGLPDELWDVIASCLAKRPADRPVAGRLAVDLGRLVVGCAGVPAVVRPDGAAPPAVTTVRRLPAPTLFPALQTRGIGVPREQVDATGVVTAAVSAGRALGAAVSAGPAGSIEAAGPADAAGSPLPPPGAVRRGLGAAAPSLPAPSLPAGALTGAMSAEAPAVSADKVSSEPGGGAITRPRTAVTARVGTHPAETRAPATRQRSAEGVSRRLVAFARQSSRRARIGVAAGAATVLLAGCAAYATSMARDSGAADALTPPSSEQTGTGGTVGGSTQTPGGPEGSGAAEGGADPGGTLTDGPSDPNGGTGSDGTTRSDPTTGTGGPTTGTGRDKATDPGDDSPRTDPGKDPTTTDPDIEQPADPEPEQPADPEPEPEQPADPEPEQPADPEPEPEQPADPEPEPEQPADPPPAAEPDPEPAPQEQTEPQQDQTQQDDSDTSTG